MIIELFGLPGTGKSTLARALQERGMVVSKVKKVPLLIWYNIQFFFQYPKTALFLLRLILKHSKPRSLFYMKFMNAFLQHNAKYVHAKKLPNAVIDQGHLQNILSVFETRLEDDDVESYIKIIPPVDRVVILQASDKVRNDRLEDRGFRPREHMSDAYLSDWNEVLQHNFAVAHNVLNKLPGSIAINAEKSKEDMVLDVQSRIL
ncbi:MAG: AAA family ATPase [Patescibacteria group bacterium]